MNHPNNPRNILLFWCPRRRSMACGHPRPCRPRPPPSAKRRCRIPPINQPKKQPINPPITTTHKSTHKNYLCGSRKGSAHFRARSGLRRMGALFVRPLNASSAGRSRPSSLALTMRRVRKGSVASLNYATSR